MPISRFIAARPPRHETGLSAAAYWGARVLLVLLFGWCALCVAVPSAFAQTSPASIAYGQTISGSLTATSGSSPDQGAGYYAGLYTFVGVAGDRVQIREDSSDFDSYMYLRDAVGNVVASNDDYNGTSSEIDITLPTTGSYVIDATTVWQGDTGAYTVSLKQFGILRVTDARGNTTISTSAFGAGGAIIAHTVQGPDLAGSPQGSNIAKTTYAPDIIHPTQIVTTDWLGRTWQSALDSFGNITQTTDPLNHVWQFGYSGDGIHLTSTTDPTNLTARFNFGENGAPASHLTSTADPAGNTVALFGYNPFGQVGAATNPAGVSASGVDETTTFDYDAATGDLVRTTAPNGDKVTVDGHDALGDPLGFSSYPDTGDPATSATPLSSVITWDPAQQPVSVLLPNGVQTFNTWTEGVVTQVQSRGPDGSVLTQATFDHDSRGRLYRASDLVGVTAQYRYDRNSNLTQVWDATGNITRFTYGAANEPTGVLWPDGASTSILYDAAGRVASSMDERGVLITHAYDATDRLIGIYPQGHDDQKWEFTYDDAGRPLTAVNPSQSLAYHYDDPDKRLTAVDYASGGRTYTVSYTYFGDGKRHTMTSPVGTTTYNYDLAGRLISLTNPFGETTTWNYDHSGRLTDETTSTGQATIGTNYVWGGSGLRSDPSTAPAYLTALIERVNGNMVRTYGLTHSYSGQLLEADVTGPRFVSFEAAPPPPFREQRTYSYDARGRLTVEHEQAFLPGGVRADPYDGAYAYDAVGNLMGGAGGWTYNASNQVVRAPSIRQAGGQDAQPQYDAAGNLIDPAGDGWLRYGYDTYGRLNAASRTLGNGSTENIDTVYDCQGLRRASRDYASADTPPASYATVYLYDGASLIAEMDGQTGLPTAAYTWGASGLISDHQYGTASDPPRTLVHLYDPSGSTAVLVDGAGSVAADYFYKAWGAPLDLGWGARNATTPFRWHGRYGAYSDDTLGLVLMGARYYAPSLGRFLSRDPAGFAGGINLYAFCGDDPIDFADPLGTDFLGLSNGTWAGIAAGAGTFLLTGNPVLAVAAGGTVGTWYSNQVDGKDLSTSVGDGCQAALLSVPAGEVCGAALNVARLTGRVLAGGAAAATAAALANHPEEVEGELQTGTLCPGGTCFVSDTPVQMADGTTKPIQFVEAGDIVRSREPETGKDEPKKVERAVRKASQELVTIQLADSATHQIVQTLQGTPNHPFFTPDKGMVPMGDLSVGTSIVTRAGPALVVASVKRESRPSGYAVFNFSVADDHTYFVGTANGGLWVHNTRDCANGGLFPEDELGEMAAPTKHGDLRARMGLPPFEGAEVHHELPWKNSAWFANRGLNVNAPQFGLWVDPADHDRWSAGYERRWDLFIQNNPNASKQSVMLFLNYLRNSGRYK